MNTLRSRCARLVVALACCLPLTACDDKKMTAAKPAARGEYAVPMAAATAPNAPDRAEPANTENYQHFVENDFVSAAAEPRSTFSASVDTAAYTIIRAKIQSGQLPPKGAVRVADMLNYFDYDYPKPTGDNPIAATLEMAPCPWNPKHHLLRIALAAKQFSHADMPPRNLVFLIDTSGSMAGANRLPLVKESLQLLTQTLTARDRVSIVTYAGDSSVRLEPIAGDQKARINAVIESLSAYGSTNGGGGIQAAYAQAAKAYIDGGVNRVILATDGDFNVGVSSESELVRLIEEKRKTGVYLTVLGFGMGNLQDAKLEKLAHHGNGHYAYVDSLDEARKLFLDQGGALAIVAKDVKLQLEFNHNRVNAYRLIGYENRLLKNEDFRNDEKDAGDMGSGHTVTALYEVVPVGVPIRLAIPGDLKYQGKTDTPAAQSGEWLTLRVRYKHPDTDAAKELEFPLGKDGLKSKGSTDFQFASAVAAFGLLLRDSEYKGTASWAGVTEWAAAGLGHDQKAYRSDFLDLVQQAERLAGKKD
ncbi:MAG TPA: VWA domain-containing protein [Gemmataceae bacterium]|nr:VWA domain-containing protein [Gemmataceae bacterium]